MQEDTKNELDGIKKTLYGTDGTGGVVGCLKKKVSTRTAIWILVAIGFPMIAGGLQVWSSQNSDHLRFVAKTEAAAMKDRLTRCEEGKEAILQELQRMNARFDKHCDDMKEQLQEIQKDMKREWERRRSNGN